MSQHFGTDFNTTDFVEQAAVVVWTSSTAGGTADTQMRISPRPEPGTLLHARDAQTLAPLPDITVDGNGYWDATTDDTIPLIQVSTDGSLWITLQSVESRIAAALQGQKADQAAVSAQAAVDAVQAHTEATDPHPQYPHFPGKNTAPAFWSRRSSEPMPTPAEGAKDDDLLFYGG